LNDQVFVTYTKQFTEGAARRPAYTIHVFKYSPHFYNMATSPHVTDWAVVDALRIYPAGPGKVVVSGGAQTASFTYLKDIKWFGSDEGDS